MRRWACCAVWFVTNACAQPHAVPAAHPRLLGSRADLQALAQSRPDAYRRMATVARGAQADDWSKAVSLSLVAAIEGDATLARQAVDLALKVVRGPIRAGHVTFAHDLALCAMVYDHCHDAWQPAAREEIHRYVNATWDANRGSETHVFHNGWYGYKHWGVGLACYAGYGENPRAGEILDALLVDYEQRAAPALRLAGSGGGWAEGYYVHYFLYEWLFFCEVARRCEGRDLYAAAPEFYRQRALASAFEMLPGIREYGSRRPIPMGDGGGQAFGGDRDKALAARQILVSHYRDDPLAPALHAFNQTTPRTSVGNYAYKDFLWRDESLPAGSLDELPLSHHSAGPGYVYARSDWSESATQFYFKCGDRFTAHQHLDNGHFLIARHELLAGDGGHYDDFASPHAVNYYLRSIAHNTLLIRDPTETWPGIRAGQVTGNDGGQHHDWPHHNGAVADAAAWQADRAKYDLGDIVEYQDDGEVLRVSCDFSSAVRAAKVTRCIRSIAFIRPGTFVICDWVTATSPDFKKTWLLQAMASPVSTAQGLQVTNGRGRLHLQTLLPGRRETVVVTGEAMYSYGGQSYLPKRDTGAVPQARIEVTPAEPAAEDVFCHVLTATDADLDAVPRASVTREGERLTVVVDGRTLTFSPPAR